jgi:hypothetical protein
VDRFTPAAVRIRDSIAFRDALPIDDVIVEGRVLYLRFGPINLPGLNRSNSYSGENEARKSDDRSGKKAATRYICAHPVSIARHS